MRFPTVPSVIFLAGLIAGMVSGCKKETPAQPRPNQPPRTYLWLFPDSTIAQGVTKQRIHWWGDDPDGIVVGYLLAVDTQRVFPPAIPNPDTLLWKWTTRNDTVVSFPLRARDGAFVVFVRAVDNTVGMNFPEGSVIRFTPEPHQVIDSQIVPLPALISAVDPRGANQLMPVRNTPPVVTFLAGQPETTYTAATFAWRGTDFDGDETIIEYDIVLNDTVSNAARVTLPAATTMITIFVPRSRSDTATTAVDADLWTGQFLGRRKLVQPLPGLRLDTLNTLYLRVRDVAGEYSPFVALPSAGRTWYVRRPTPTSRLLVVADYLGGGIGDTTTVRNFYRATFQQIAAFSIHDELNIARGLDVSTKTLTSTGQANPRYGHLVPAFIDPALVFTLYLYDYVFWYTDQIPLLQVAQLCLSYYGNPNYTFEGRRGRVIFTTAFEREPDPRNTLRDFAPVDSVSTVGISSGGPFPRLGANQIPGGYELYPDSTGPLMYPPLRFNTDLFAYPVYMRPVYKRADARYLYRIQPDTRIPPQYAYVVTINDWRSLAQVGAQGLCAAGNGATIGLSTNRGITWAVQTHGVVENLRSVYFLDQTRGWIVGDNGTILSTDDGGLSWTNRSLVTAPPRNFLGVHFANTQTGVIVGSGSTIITTTDGGNTWISRPSPSTRTLRDVRFMDDTTVIAVGDTMTILYSTNRGFTWIVKTASGVPGQLTVSVLNAVRRVPGTRRAYAVGNRGMMVTTTDGGDTWTRQAVTIFGSLELRTLHFADQTSGWIGGAAGVLFRTNDGGATWSMPTPQPPTTQGLNGVMFFTPNSGIIAGGGGIFLGTDNAGASWSYLPRGSLNVAAVDGNRRFVFVGLPLHLLDGNSGLVRNFLQYILTNEFVGP